MYDVLTTTPWDLREFGLGVAMYFQTLQLLAVVFFVCGVLQASAIDYYMSPAYSDSQVSRERPKLVRRELIVRGEDS